MDASTLLIAFSVIFSFSNAQITVGDNDRPNAPSEGDVDSRFFNIDFGNINLGGIAETALGTTLGNLGTGFLQDCLGIGKRSIIMDRLVNERIFCTNNNNGYNGGGGFGGFGGSNRPNCRTCSCYNDNRCYNTCDKCYQGYNNYNTGGFSGNTGGSSNFGSSNSNFGSSNSNYGNSNSNYGNSNSG